MKTFLQISFFFLLVSQICFAQWVQLGLEDKGIKDIASRNSDIFAVTSDSAVYRSNDSGANWTMILDSTARDVAISPSGKVFLIKTNNDDFWWGDSLYSSLDNGETWVNVNIEKQLLDSMLCEPQNITISPEGIVYCCVHYPGCIGGHLDAIAQSSDDGVTWITTCVDVMGGEIFDFRFPSIITVGASYYCSTTAWSSIYRSSDYGNSWTYLGYPPPTNALALFSNGNIIVGGEGSLNISTNNCSTWTQIATLNINCGLSYSNVLSEGILVGTDLGVFLFSNEGDSLGSFNDGLSNLKTHTLSMDNNGYVYIGTDHGLWRRPLSEIIPVELTSFTATTNGKEVILNWSTATEINNHGFKIQRSTEGVEFLTVGFVKGYGTTTERQNYNYADKNLDNGKYYYRLKQVDYDGSYEYSDAVEVELIAFNSYLLAQNFPNPFNPTTTIGFGIQNKSSVKVTVLNIIGEEVAVLLNEEREAGFYQVEFDATNLPSGVYFYQLKAGEYTEVKKMILIK